MVAWTRTWALVWALMLGWASQRCDGFGTFGFDVHHRFSDPVKGILSVDDLPEKGSVEYYWTMAHRDRVMRGRHLAESNDPTALTFFNGNDTYMLNSLGFLYYANITLGTPSKWFLVALDTGSDLFWLPCDCNTSCVHGLINSKRQQIAFNIYSPNASSSSAAVNCSSSLCAQQRLCSSARDTCPYKVEYLSVNTSSTGILVEDVLHLTPDDNQFKVVDTQITLGCGHNQTGSFLEGAAPNGLFGLGMSNISVPSILAEQGIASNSFSMCFGPDGIGRIRFGDNGSSDQGETPFNILGQRHPTYNVSITQINMNGTVTDIDFSAIFDSGTSFTYLNDPAYTRISESFDSFIKERRHSSDTNIPFDYCYDISPNQTTIDVPNLNLTMKGGQQFFITDPLVIISDQNQTLFCLGLVKSEDVNIIGQNFMTGYQIVFDREKMVLGWKASDCYDAANSNTLPISPTGSTVVPPATAFNPDATAGGSNNPQVSSIPSSAGNGPLHLNPFVYVSIFVLPFFTIF
ncbi:hypothetical protein HS088_TW14G00046 [Tripterygium wilfordii]|uniref:Peptidase A1 domain-containing protein n=1 Tax=Tripterygium wilfordii TaxID=458696 RepID=A0A7J7CPV2_TRIWF|nr:aspartyl protease family protein 1-like [Tripterygium wilfordii]KAF5735916.1 hypothetical protein HS088_TW14G00046 [Tripterygium wilfordii]